MLFRVLLDRAWGWGLALSSIGGDLKAGTLSTGAVSLVACGSAQQETRWQIASEQPAPNSCADRRRKKLGVAIPCGAERLFCGFQSRDGALDSRNEL